MQTAYDIPESSPERGAVAPGRRRRIIVIGAGMAGLVAGYELLKQGHDPIILEAQNRVGGRVHTLRQFAPGLYAEAGAMRIPSAHDLTMSYCRHFNLRLQPFVMECARSPVYLAGQHVTWGELSHDPKKNPFELADHEKGKTFADLWYEATREVRESYGDQPDALKALGREYDRYSIREFLIKQGFSQGALELYGIMSNREAIMDVSSVVEQLRELIGHSFEDMYQIEGGMDLLPRAFYGRLGKKIRLGAQVVAVEQGKRNVTVHYKTAVGMSSCVGDYCICTLPFGVLRHLDFKPPLSIDKYRAIRSLNYNPSTKILLQVRNRFWERKGIFGGSTPTDLPIRLIVYPSHAPSEDGRGILLASYTWGQDAARWGALSPQDRISLAVKDVAKIHPEIIDEFEGGRSYAWYNDDPYAVGAFALFHPGQEVALSRDIVKTEGRVHFAGEHCSLWHGWIQGALDSGLRAARAVVETEP